MIDCRILGQVDAPVQARDLHAAAAAGTTDAVVPGTQPVPAADRLPSRWGMLDRPEHVVELVAALDARGEREGCLLSALQVLLLTVFQPI